MAGSISRSGWKMSKIQLVFRASPGNLPVHRADVGTVLLSFSCFILGYLGSIQIPKAHLLIYMFEFSKLVRTVYVPSKFDDWSSFLLVLIVGHSKKGLKWSLVNLRKVENRSGYLLKYSDEFWWQVKNWWNVGYSRLSRFLGRLESS